MKVLVTGVSGFIGSWVAEDLLNKGHTVVGIDNLSGGYKDNIPKHKLLTSYNKDITDLYSMSILCNGCDVVYHCAAMAYEGLSVFSPYTITNNIVSGTASVATAAIKCGVKKFINCSSMARYGNRRPPFVEELAPAPVDPYGIAKVAAESLVNMLGEVHGMHVVNIVPHNVIGPRQKYNDPFRNVASIMINLILSGRNPIIYGDGNQVRCFSHIDDILPVMIGMLDYETEHGEVFNVGPDSGMISITKLANTIAELLDIRIKPKYIDPRPCEVRLAYCSSQKIRTRFGYESKVDLRQGLQTIIDYIRKRGVLPFDYGLRVEIQNNKLPVTWKDKLL